MKRDTIEMIRENESPTNIDVNGKKKRVSRGWTGFDESLKDATYGQYGLRQSQPKDRKTLLFNYICPGFYWVRSSKDS